VYRAQSRKGDAPGVQLTTPIDHGDYATMKNVEFRVVALDATRSLVIACEYEGRGWRRRDVSGACEGGRRGNEGASAPPA
jgi:hypothetical protein